MSSPVGKERAVSSAALSEALKGHIWGLQLDGVEYDVEFLGKLSMDGEQIVKVKKKSEKQPKEETYSESLKKRGYW